MPRQSSSLFQPPNPPTYSNVDQCIRFEEITNGAAKTHETAIIWLYTETGSRIPATFFRKKRAELTVLFSHSVDEDIGASCTYARRLCRHCNVNVFCYEYSGYGLSSGKASEKNFYTDIQAAYNFLVGEEDLIAEQIILLGRSVGSGPTCELACKKVVKAMILVSPILSVMRMEKSRGSAIRLVGQKDRFENITKIGEIGCPILFVHGKKDKRVPLKDAIELWQKTLNPIPPLYVEAGHDNAESADYDKVFARYQELFDSLGCPVMDNIPKDRSGRRGMGTEPLMSSHVTNVMQSSTSSMQTQSITSIDRTSSRRESKTKKPSLFAARKSFSGLHQVSSVEVIPTFSPLNSSRSNPQPATGRFRSLGFQPSGEGGSRNSKSDAKDNNK